MDQDQINEILTLTKEEQELLISEGKCPHNKGWKFRGFGHNDTAYSCLICDEYFYY